MNIFTNILKANSRITELEKSVSDWHAKYEILNDEKNTLTSSIEEYMLEKAELEKTIETLKATVTTKVEEVKVEATAKIENLEVKVQEEQKSAADRAVEIVASLGVDPDLIKTTAKDATMIVPTKGYKVISHLPLTK